MTTWQSGLRSGLQIAAVLALVAWQGSEAQAQRRYQPRTGTVSPYLNLTRTNFGALPNYYSLVRPQMDQVEFNREQVDFNQREVSLRQSQAQQLGKITQSIQTGVVPASPTGKSSGFQVNSQKYQFMSPGRYFPAPPGARRR
jgi:hypothetical protein